MALELVSDASKRYLDLQIRSNDNLDGRISGAVALGTTIIPLSYGLLSLSSLTVPLPATGFLAIGLAAYVALLVLAIRASRYRGFDFRPDLDDLASASARLVGDDLLLQEWINEEYRTATQSNRSTLETKSRLVGWIVVAVYAEGLALAVSAVLRLWPLIRPAVESISVS